MPKLNYKTLRQEVVDEIRQGILTGDFQAGERIKENEMAQQLGVSRGPVREALRQLEQEGLVQYERNVGCSVAQVSGQDVYEICLLRATLEILAARLLQKGKSVQQGLRQMQDCVEQMEQADYDFYQLAQQDNRFHAAVIEQAGLKKLAELWKSTNIHNLAIFYAGRNNGSFDRQEYCQSHQRLLECYHTGDICQISKEIVQHYSLKASRPIEDVFTFS